MRLTVFFFLFLWLLLFPAKIFGQQAAVGELQSQLKSADNQQRVDILVSLMEALKQSEPKQAKKYADEAFKLSSNLNYPEGIIASGFFLGIAERDRGKETRAIKATEAGIAAARSAQDQRSELEGLEILRAIYLKLGDSQRVNEIELASKRLLNTIDLNRRNQQYSNLNQKYREKEQALVASEADNNRISSENQKIQEELRQLQIETLLEKAKLDSLEKEKVQLELQTLKAENELMKYDARLKRQRHIQSLLIIGFIVAILGIGGLVQYYRLKRIREVEKLKSQRQLMMQEKMATLGQLTAGMAHEIQNPLNFVNNFAEGSSEMARELEEVLMKFLKTQQKDQLQLCKELTTDLQRNSEDIIENGQRISRIVRSMMEHARGNKGKIEPTEINALVQQNLNLAYHGYRGMHPDFNATLEESYDKSIDKIEAIPQDLSRVFLNIFGNACYALHQKQKNSPPDYSPTLSVSSQNQNSAIIITIRDNGPGIPEAIRNKIFTPFFSTKSVEEGNTGLGLSISYDIVVQGHHGKLEVQSQIGEFTEFRVYLPS